VAIPSLPGAYNLVVIIMVITSPPTHSVRGLVTLDGVCRHHLLGSVTHCGGAAMTSCRLQSNYSSVVTLHGGPVVLYPVRATACL